MLSKNSLLWKGLQRQEEELLKIMNEIKLDENQLNRFFEYVEWDIRDGGMVKESYDYISWFLRFIYDDTVFFEGMDYLEFIVVDWNKLLIEEWISEQTIKDIIKNNEKQLKKSSKLLNDEQKFIYFISKKIKESYLK